MEIKRPIKLYLSMVALTLIAIGFSAWTNARSEAKWCDVVVTTDKAYSESPPSSEAGKQWARDFKTLRHRLDC